MVDYYEPAGSKENSLATANIGGVHVRKRGSRRRGILLLVLFLIAVIAGLGWWSQRARQADRLSPAEGLLREVLAPSVRAAGEARNRLLPGAGQGPAAPLSPLGEARLRQLEEENRQLRETLSLRDRLPSSGLAAEVVGRSITPWQGSLLLGQGAAAGIVPHMVALTPSGVLGQVADVTAHTAGILPLTDPASGIPAMTERTKAPGVLKGAGGGLCKLVYLTGDADVQPGDQVITSGMGTVFPRGLPLGEVLEVRHDAALSAQTAAVKPAVDPATVVFVVLAK